jgi:hypothetical protein
VGFGQGTFWGSGVSRVLGAAICLLLASCASNTDSYTKECVLNSNQKGTINGRWSAKPVPIAVIVNDFNAAEVQAIRASIGTWNDFFQASKGFQLFLANGAPLSTVPSSTPKISTSSICSQNFLSASGFNQPIVIQKVISGWSHSTGIMAITGTCPQVVAGAQFKYFSSAVMEVNYANFFSPGLPQPDLQSIITHELGHLLGLNHSCDGVSGSSTMVSCAQAPQDYLQAIMFPSLGFDGTRGKVNRALRTNDQQRANCLY